jgi:radical SAM protein with 4Fe4S-binding SPASM domain
MISGVNASMKNGIQILGVTVLSSQSPEEYEKIIIFCREKGFSGHKTNPLIPAGKGRELFERSTFYKHAEKYYVIWKKHKKISNNKFIVTAEPSFIMMFNDNTSSPDDSGISPAGCPAGILTCAVNECGDVLPCSFFTQVTAGNIRKESFYDIWYKSAVLTQLRLRNFKGMCGNCKHKNLCGGCRARAYSGGKLNLSDSYCYLSKKH